MQHKNIHYVEPIYVEKLYKENNLSMSGLGNMLGCSNSHIKKSLLDKRIRMTYEEVAKRIYKEKFEKPVSLIREVKVVEKKPAPAPANDAVLMVVISNHNLDFLTRIVRSLKGEITEV